MRRTAHDLIVDKETNERVYLLGVAGYQSTVKGILANMLKGESLSVEVNKKSIWVERFSDKLPDEDQENALRILSWDQPSQDRQRPRRQGNPYREFLLISEDPLEVKGALL